MVEREEEKRSFITNRYKILFHSNADDLVHELLQHTFNQSCHVNLELIKDFTTEEINKELYSIDDLKTHGG